MRMREAARLEEEQCREFERPWDTTDQVHLPDTASLFDVYEAVIGEAMKHTDLVGVVSSGQIEVQSLEAKTTWGKTNVRFKPHKEVWQIRSHPKNRIGKPLMPDEYREVVVLLRHGDDKIATVSTIRLWRMQGLLHKIDYGKARYDRCRTTDGATGVAFHGLNIFNERATYEGDDGTIYNVSKNCNCHSVLSSFTTVLDDYEKDKICRVEACHLPQYVVAAHLAGFSMPDEPLIRPCEERFSENEWRTATCMLMNEYVTRLQSRLGSNPQPCSDMPGVYIFSAECVFEQASFVWLLDAMGDRFYEEALADDLHQPSKISLILAMAVRIACHPKLWGLRELRGDDAYATKMASILLEAVQPSLLTTSTDAGATHQTFAIDIAITHACQQMNENLEGLRNNTIDSNAHKIDADEMELRYNQALAYLFCAGVAICQDTCGLIANNGDNTSGLMTNDGLATWYADPGMESAAQSAYAHGLGNVQDKIPLHRKTTRGSRQKALVNVMQNVEEWICTGKYRGIIHAQNTTAACDSALVTNVHVQDLKVGKEPAPVCAAPASQNASRKKKGHRNAAPKDANTSLANKGKRRGANDRNRADFVLKSLVKNRNGLSASDTDKLGDKMSGYAIDEASGTLGDLLQVGAVFGIGQYFDYRTYVVGSNSRIVCATCPCSVDVVASVAFSGLFGYCKRCSHPRCLKCVSEDIDLVAANHTTDPLVREPTSAQVNGCLRCSETMK